jgi:hypothetical protein
MFVISLFIKTRLPLFTYTLIYIYIYIYMKGFGLPSAPPTTDSSYGNAPWANSLDSNQQSDDDMHGAGGPFTRESEATSSSTSSFVQKNVLPSYLQSPPKAKSMLPAYLQSPDSPSQASTTTSTNRSTSIPPPSFPLTTDSSYGGGGGQRHAFPVGTSEASLEIPSTSSFRPKEQQPVAPALAAASPPPSPPLSPERRGLHDDDAEDDDEQRVMGNTETQFEQMIRDAEGNALLFAEIRADAVNVLEKNAKNKM